MRPFFAFLKCLLQDFEDGRILVSTKSGSEFIKYLVLNPGAHFNTLVKQCRAVSNMIWYPENPIIANFRNFEQRKAYSY